jgi:hypothetical protein
MWPLPRAGLIHPSRRRLLVAGSVRRIISGFDFREPLDAGGMDLSDPVLDRQAMNFFLVVAIPEDPFQMPEGRRRFCLP